MNRVLVPLFFIAFLSAPLINDCQANTDSIAAYVASSGEGFDWNYADYDVLLAAASKAGLVGALADPNANLTLFAPNDLAFVLLARDLGYSGFSEAGAWAFIDDNVPTSLLSAILLYHVAGQELSAFDVILAGIFRNPIQSLLGETFQPSFLTLIDKDDDAANPTIFAPLNVRTGNGFVHTISRVLRPADL